MSERDVVDVVVVVVVAAHVEVEQQEESVEIAQANPCVGEELALVRGSCAL